jgi:hypothetical protein
VPLIVAALLGSCSAGLPMVSPQGGEVPERPVLYTDTVFLEARDREGRALPITELSRSSWRRGFVRAVRVEAEAGVEFRLRAIWDARQPTLEKSEFGPYRVRATPPSPPGPTQIGEARRILGAVLLTLDPPAPAWRVEVNGEPVVLLSMFPYLGYLDCRPSTYDWTGKVGRVSIRAAALDAAGVQGPFGPAIELRPPLPFAATLGERTVDFLLDHAAWLVAAALLVSTAGAIRTRRARRGPSR